MIESLPSPILFPSDVNSSNLTADPNFKLPEPMNWVDHDYYCTMMDRSMGCLTAFNDFVPISKSYIHHDSLRFVSTLDMVEKDMQRTGGYCLYSLSEYKNDNVKNHPYLINSNTTDWLCHEDYIDVPDLVHSIHNSHSLTSLEHGQPTSVTHLDDSFPIQQITTAVANTRLMSSFLPNNAQQIRDKKKNKTFKKWATKMKQNCINLMPNATRKLCYWIKD